MLHILWEFRVKKDRTVEFEEHYGPDGTWARFFRAGRGFRETRLLRDRESPERYLTMDVWDDLDSFRAFTGERAGDYQAIDARCAELTDEERCLGYFEAE